MVIKIDILLQAHDDFKIYINKMFDKVSKLKC